MGSHRPFTITIYGVEDNVVNLFHAFTILVVWGAPAELKSAGSVHLIQLHWLEKGFYGMARGIPQMKALTSVD